MSNKQYLRIDEQEDAVCTLEWAKIQAQSINGDPYYWKWFIVSLHGALQSFMVLALWKGNGLLTLRDDIAKRWLSAYESDRPFPYEKSDSFLNLYGKIQKPGNLPKPYVPEHTEDNSVNYLNSIRNDFIHFMPKGWSIGIAGLPKICLDVLNVVSFLCSDARGILWHKKVYAKRVNGAVKQLRALLQDLASQYKSP